MFSQYKKLMMASVAGFGLAMANPAAATEVGGGVYQNGAEGYSAAALPPPGTYFLGYALHYEADRFNDGDGNAEFLPNFDAEANAVVARLVHNTGVKILGADWTVHVIQPIVDLDVSIAGSGDDTTGLGDMTVNPILLGWHNANGLHVTTGVDVNIPIGSYDPTKLSNIGRNHWNIEPLVAVAYYPKSGFTFDLKMMYDINFTNKDGAITPFNPNGADYRSGNEFHADFAIGQQLGKVKLGVSGYYYKQTTDDKVDDPVAQAGLDALNGFKGEAFAAGPSIAVAAGKVLLIGSWQHEFSSTYRPQGDKFWLKAIVPLG